MGLSCVFGHKWNACTCERCGKINDKLHKWNHCTCEVCGKNRGKNHNYVNVLGTCEEKCTVCGITREGWHKGNSCICSTCGKAKPGEHYWGCKPESDGPTGIIRCRRCGYGITWHELVQQSHRPGNLGGGVGSVVNHLWEKQVIEGSCWWVCSDCGHKKHSIEKNGKEVVLHAFENMPNCRKVCKDCGVVYYDHRYARTGKTKTVFVHMDTYEREVMHEHKCRVCGQLAWDGADWDDSPVWEQGEVE